MTALNTYRNIKLTIEYDGTHFSGWQRQAKERTVQGEIEKALRKLTSEKINLIAAGRTDAGVHALGQVANFKTKARLPIDNFTSAINSLLPRDILIKRAQEVALKFNARRDAKRKTYRYRIFLAQTVLQRNYLWPYRFQTALPQIRKAVRMIVGKHDFTSFCVAKSQKESNICIIKKAVWKKSGNILELEIEGDRFLRSMIRILVGTLMEVGRGKITPIEFKEILSARDRRRAGPTAPACGLYLVKVKY
jgi:tRNA pseudouridine38-40 synthase